MSEKIEPKTNDSISGLILIGRVNAKTSQVYKNGDEHFFVFVTAPGSTSLYKVELKPEKWGAYQEEAPFKMKVNYSVFKDQITFHPAA